MIIYRDDAALDREQFIELYRASTLGVRRPLDDCAIVEAMMRHGNLTITAWEDDLLVGVARTLTDFLYVGYMSDLAVRESHQRQGIGVELIAETRRRMGPRSSLILLAAPAAENYYPRIGFQHVPRAWMLRSTDPFPAVSG